MLLAIDPSVASPGVALFDENGKLLGARRILVKSHVVENASDGERWLHAAKQVVNWATDYGHRCVYDLVFEKPQIYRASKSKGDPNDLIGLAGMAMAVAGMLEGIRVSSPTPAEWIGNIPKTTKGSAKESPRAKRILSRLTPTELALVPDQHDAIDSVGLGLWRLGRLEPRRNFSNGRDE